VRYLRQRQGVVFAAVDTTLIVLPVNSAPRESDTGVARAYTARAEREPITAVWGRSF